MDFFYQYNKELEVPSRQAVSQAREKISFSAFQDLFEKSCELAIEGDGARLFNGFRLFAVDGTSFIVGPHDKLTDFFGETTAVKGSAMCRISGVVDVLNDCIVDAAVAPFNVGERSLAIEQVQQLKTVSNALFLFDRGYWSPILVSKIIHNNQRFLMRLASNVGKTEVTNQAGTPYPLRRCSFLLPNGEMEILLTNIPEEELSNDDLAELYTKRWGVETKYLELKDRLQIDKFSSVSANIILQDIYSTLYISNLVAFICFESDEIIEERTAGKNNKYAQKANRSTCIAALRKRFIDICLMNDDNKLNSALQRLYHDISRDVTYIDKSKPKPRDKRKIKQARSSKFKTVL